MTDAVDTNLDGSNLRKEEVNSSFVDCSEYLVLRPEMKKNIVGMLILTLVTLNSVIFGQKNVTRTVLKITTENFISLYLASTIWQKIAPVLDFW
jgi:hypothetical protein